MSSAAMSTFCFVPPALAPPYPRKMIASVVVAMAMTMVPMTRTRISAR